MRKLFPYLIEKRGDRPLLGLDCPAGFVRQAGNPEDRTLEFIGSTEDSDRYREIISVGGWDLKAYRLNPVFLFGHDYYSPPIGRGMKVWKDLDSEPKRLMFNIKFASPEEFDFADTIYRLYQGGYMNAVSVGFLPTKWEENQEFDEKDPKSAWRIFMKQELLELSAVAVPANPYALVNALQKGVVREPEFNRLKTLGVHVEREVIDLSTYPQIGGDAVEDDSEMLPATNAAVIAQPAHRYFCGKCLAEMSGPGCTHCAECRKVLPVDALTETPTPEITQHWFDDPDLNKIKNTCVIPYVQTEFGGSRLILVSPEFMESLGQTNGATIEWQDSEPYLREQIILAGLRLLKAKVFGELPEARQDAILCGTPDEYRIDPLLHDDLASALFSAVIGGPVEVKAGAVLNKRNLARVKAIKGSAEEILAEAEPAKEDEPVVPIINDDDPTVVTLVPVTPPVPEKCPGDSRPACPPELEIVEVVEEKDTMPPAGDGWATSDPNIPDAHGLIEFVESTPPQAAEEPVLELLPAVADGGTPQPVAPHSPQGQGDTVLELDAKGADGLASVVANIVRQTLAEATGDVRYAVKGAKRR